MQSETDTPLARALAAEVLAGLGIEGLARLNAGMEERRGAAGAGPGGR